MSGLSGYQSSHYLAGVERGRGLDREINSAHGLPSGQQFCCLSMPDMLGQASMGAHPEITLVSTPPVQVVGVGLAGRGLNMESLCTK